MSAIIRVATADDDEAVVDLWQRCGLTRPWNDPWRDLARNRAHGVAALVVDDPSSAGVEAGRATRQRVVRRRAVGRRIVGSVLVGYDGHRGWVNYLAADPEQRGLGLGRALMEEAERRLAAVGCPKLNLQVRAGNHAVLSFYEALGYQVDGAVLMGKRLIDD